MNQVKANQSNHIKHCTCLSILILSYVTFTQSNFVWAYPSEKPVNKQRFSIVSPTPPLNESHGSWGLRAINAQAAYDLGITGKDIRVGILDSGIDLQHSEFIGKNHYGLKFSKIFEGKEVTVDGGEPLRLYGKYAGRISPHGTMVGGIIAAAKNNVTMHGVAYNSQLVSSNIMFFFDVLIYDADKKMSEMPSAEFLSFYAQAIKLLPDVGNVRVINNSIGIFIDFSEKYKGNWSNMPKEAITAYLSSNPLAQSVLAPAEKGILQVWANGNNADSNLPLLDVAGFPYYFSHVEPYWITVAGTNKNNQLVKYDADNLSLTPCGAAAQWCIAAPGADLLTPIPSRIASLLNFEIDFIDGMPSTGSSFAAPHVTGAVALAMERFPYMTTPQIREVILTTATDLGEPGVDAIYGHGLLNIAGAMRGPGQFRTDFIAYLPKGTQDTWSHHVWGPGGLVKDGEGTLLLNGNHTHSGMVRIQRGELAINGQIRAPVSVEVSGWLRGTGTLLGEVMIKGGLAPGYSAGALTFNAPLTLMSSSRTLLDIDGLGTGSGAGNYSRIIVNGAAISLNGTMEPRLRGISGDANNTFTPALGSHFAVLSASSGFNGGFTTLMQPGMEGGLAAGQRFDLLFQGSQAILTVSPVTLPGLTLGGNSAAGAQVLNAVRDTSMALRPGIYNTWLGQTLHKNNPTDLTYRRLGGQIYADVLGWGMHYQYQIGQSLFDQIAGWTEVTMASRFNYVTSHRAVDQSSFTDFSNNAFWVQILPYDQQRHTASPDRLDIQTRSETVLLGLEHRESGQARVGFALGWAKGKVSQESASIQQDGFSANLYIYRKLFSESLSAESRSFVAQHAYVIGQLGYAQLSGDTQRTLSAMWNSVFTSHVRTQHTSLGLGIGTYIHARKWRLNPELNLWHTNSKRNALIEQASGDNSFALAVDAMNTNQTIFTAQLRANQTIETKYGKWIPQGVIGYQYGLNKLAPSTAHLSYLEGVPTQMIIQSAAMERVNLLRLGLGVALHNRLWQAGLQANVLRSLDTRKIFTLGWNAGAQLVRRW